MVLRVLLNEYNTYYSYALQYNYYVMHMAFFWMVSANKRVLASTSTPRLPTMLLKVLESYSYCRGKIKMNIGVSSVVALSDIRWLLDSTVLLLLASKKMSLPNT
jgi:hypothetical protein